MAPIAFLSLTAPTLTGLLALAGAEAARATESANVQDQSETIDVEVGRSRHIRAPWDVAGASLTNPEIADIQVLTPTLLLVSGRQAGSTDLHFWSATGEMRTAAIEVRLNLDVLGLELASIFPDSTLSVRSSRNTLLVSGAVADADEAQQIKSYMDSIGVLYVDMTTLPGVQQVQVQVRMAEVSRMALRTLGVNGFVAGNDFFGGSTVGPSSGGPINPISIGPPEGALAQHRTPFVFTQPGDVSPAVTLFGGVPSADLEFFIQALEENQYLRILAEPNLVALSGQEASFLAGGEFPIPVVQGGTGGGGGTSITIEYKEFGVGLTFRPIVLGGGAIRLQVASEVSDLSDIGSVQIQGFRVPAIVTRRADTTLEMKSGQTFAMAGLISETTNAQVAKTPGLGSIPILGSLFRSVAYRRGETELLLLVTASLVEPASDPVLLPVPGDDHIVPSDWELYTQARLEGAVPPRLSPDDAAWVHSMGLDRLRGPGAWATHEEPGPQSSRKAKSAAAPSEPTGDEAQGAAAPQS